jgi:predicted kinase
MPMIIAVLGLPGSGKSYFAEKLSDRVGAVYLNSDQTRNDLGARGKYTAEDKLFIYRVMAEKAGQVLDAGKHVVVDATFYKQDMIDQFKELAKTYASSVWFIKIEADEDLIKSRLAKPRTHSEADYNVYRKIKQQFEEPQVPYLSLRSENDNVNSMLDQALDYIGVHE